MKIGVVKETLTVGGMERAASNFSRALCKDHQVYMVVHDSCNAKYPYGGELVDLCLPSRKSIVGKAITCIKRARKYKLWARENNVDILFELLNINDPLCFLKHSKTIRIMSLRDYSELCRMPYKFHACLQRSDAMICNSVFQQDAYLSRYPEHKDRVFTVCNIIDIPGINEQAKEDVETNFTSFRFKHPKTVVAVGRFCKEKGFEYLLQSIAQARQNNPDIGLVLVGGGDYLGGYKDIIRDLGLAEHVYLTGYQSNPYKYMAKCDCFVLSSLTEGFPNVLAEAMALGLPVIATNCLSGPAEILRDDMDYDAVTDQFALCDYGIMTPRMTDGNNDHAVQELSHAIVTLLSDSELMKRYSQLAKSRAALYSEDAARTKLNKIFQLLMARRMKDDQK